MSFSIVNDAILRMNGTTEGYDPGNYNTGIHMWNMQSAFQDYINQYSMTNINSFALYVGAGIEDKDVFWDQGDDWILVKTIATNVSPSTFASQYDDFTINFDMSKYVTPVSGQFVCWKFLFNYSASNGTTNNWLHLNRWYYSPFRTYGILPEGQYACWCYTRVGTTPHSANLSTPDSPGYPNVTPTYLSQDLHFSLGNESFSKGTFDTAYQLSLSICEDENLSNGIYYTFYNALKPNDGYGDYASGILNLSTFKNNDIIPKDLPCVYIKAYAATTDIYNFIYSDRVSSPVYKLVNDTKKMFVKTAEGWKSINVHKPSITNDIAVKGHTTLSKIRCFINTRDQAEEYLQKLWGTDIGISIGGASSTIMYRQGETTSYAVYQGNTFNLSTIAALDWFVLFPNGDIITQNSGDFTIKNILNNDQEYLDAAKWAWWVNENEKNVTFTKKTTKTISNLNASGTITLVEFTISNSKVYQASVIVSSTGHVFTQFTFTYSGGGVACLNENTLINTERGLIKIKNIKTDDKILTVNKENKLEYNKVNHIYKHKPKYVYKIQLENNQIIKATWSHEFYINETEIKRCIDLADNDYLIDDNFNKYKIISIEKILNNEDVYELWTDNNNYLIEKNRILNHCENINEINKEEFIYE